MATYPQGVTDFIPDYQPYQPDLNTTANVLQLKQTQYDRNWESLNKVYGQIYNAPLTHDQSLKNRDQLVKQIDFNLRRVSGLDLSLDQNVQQATQVFRPFYEDSSLMKDMAWTKNTTSQRARGEGSGVAVKKEDRDQYWAGGLRVIDYKTQEFKDTPYEQLSGVGNVKWTPYVRVFDLANKLAKDSGLSVDVTQESPDHKWLIRQKNGEPLEGRLQDLFYSSLGSDPAIQEMYQAQAYLARKDTIAGTKDNPEFGGDAALAEKKYLSTALTMLKSQNTLEVQMLQNQKTSYEKNLANLQTMVTNGTASPDTQTAIDQLTSALSQTSTRLEGAQQNLSLVSNNLNKTLTTSGGSKLSMEDLNDMRFRIDNASASAFMQADFDKAAHDFAYRDFVYDQKPNPYQVNVESHGHRMSEISARSKAQWDLALLKHGLKQEELDFEAKKDSGKYILTEDKNGKVTWKKNPVLNNIIPVTGQEGVIGPSPTKKVQKHITDVLGLDVEQSKKLATSILGELNDEGVLSDESILKIVGDQGLSPDWQQTITKYLKNHVINPDQDWSDINLKNHKKSTAEERRNTKVDVLKQGIYKTSLEKEDEIRNQEEENKRPIKTRVQEKLKKLSNSKIEDVDAVQVDGFFTRLFAELSDKKYRDDPNIRDNPKIAELYTKAYQFQDYAAYIKNVEKAKIKTAEIVINRLKNEGFKYADSLYDENWDKKSLEEWTADLIKNKPDEIRDGTGITLAGALTATTGAAGVGGTLGLMGGPFAPITVSAGTAVGAVSGLGGYLLTKGVAGLYNSMFGEEGSDIGLTNGMTGPMGQNTVAQEYNQMNDVINEAMVEGNKTDWMIPVVGLFNGGLDGSGKYTTGGAGLMMRPGVTNTDIFPAWTELQNIIGRVSTTDPKSGAYVSVNGINKTRDEAGDLDENASIWRILNNKLQTELLNKDSKIGDVLYSVNPLAGGEFGKASITIQPQSVDFLKKYVKSDTNPNGAITSDTYNSILKNGVSLITNANDLIGSTVYRNSYQSRIEARVEAEKKVVYKDHLDPDYQWQIEMNNIGTSKYKITEQYKIYNPNTKRDTIFSNVVNLAEMGKNLEFSRDRFFSEIVPEVKNKRIQDFNLDK
jgi:hypothetical protein